MTMPWQWRLDPVEEEWRRVKDEWRFYPGTIEYHLRLIERPGHQPYVAALVDTFLSKEQCNWLASSILSEYSNLKGQEVIEMNREAVIEAKWESCE